MRYKTISFFLSILLSTSMMFLNAQNGNVSAGGDFNSNVGNISFSIGQTYYSNIETQNGTINEGIQQVYIEDLTNIEETNNPYKIKAYPNPTSNWINIEIEGRYANNLKITLTDIQGKIITECELEKSKMIISLENLSSGVYFLNVFNQLEKKHIFKIVKE